MPAHIRSSASPGKPEDSGVSVTMRARISGRRNCSRRCATLSPDSDLKVGV